MLTSGQAASLRTGDPVPRGKAACRYERARGPWRFRDCLFLYRDGRIRLERSCYGEAAGIVFSVWAPPLGEGGALLWQDLPATAADVPRAVTGMDETGALLLDGRPAPWACTEILDSDRAHGYRKKRFGLL